MLDKLLKTLEEITSNLDEFVKNGYDLNNWRDQMAALHALQIQAQIFLDIVQRLLSNMGISTEGYKESIRRLKEKGIINDREEKFLNSVVGFRNIVVHEYSEVNLDIVDEILRNKEYKRILEIALAIKDRAKEFWDS